MGRLILITILLLISTNLVIADDVMVQVRIKQDTPYGEFNDALYYPLADYSHIKGDQIQAERQQRIDNWISAMQNPPEVKEPTKEDLQLQADELQKQIDDLTSRKEEVDSKIEFIDVIKMIKALPDAEGISK